MHYPYIGSYLWELFGPGVEELYDLLLDGLRTSGAQVLGRYQLYHLVQKSGEEENIAIYVNSSVFDS
mgnify:FL=1